VIAGDTRDAESAAEAAETRGSVTDLEISLLLDGIQRLSGYDFREYAPTLLKRRVTERVRIENARTITGLLERVVHDPACRDALVNALTTAPSIPFRDAAAYASLARDVLPRLRTYPFFRIWVAGNAADAYPIAILLHEANLLARARIYATEATDSGLADAKLGLVRPDALAGIEDRYVAAGGRADLEAYLLRGRDGTRFVSTLADNVLFARHDLASEGSFNEFQAVVVRASLASYGRSLAYRVHRTLFESTARLGFLNVTSPEAMATSPHRGAFEPLPGCEAVYRRVR